MEDVVSPRMSILQPIKGRLRRAADYRVYQPAIGLIPLLMVCVSVVIYFYFVRGPGVVVY